MVQYCTITTMLEIPQWFKNVTHYLWRQIGNEYKILALSANYLFHEEIKQTYRQTTGLMQNIYNLCLNHQIIEMLICEIFPQQQWLIGIQTIAKWRLSGLHLLRLWNSSFQCITSAVPIMALHCWYLHWSVHIRYWLYDLENDLGWHGKYLAHYPDQSNVLMI